MTFAQQKQATNTTPFNIATNAITAMVLDRYLLLGSRSNSYQSMPTIHSLTAKDTTYLILCKVKQTYRKMQPTHHTYLAKKERI